jgi:hypothetical protein
VKDIARRCRVAHSVVHFRERLTVHSCPSLSHLRFEAASSLRNSLEAKIDLWPVRSGKRAPVGSPEPSLSRCRPASVVGSAAVPVADTKVCGDVIELSLATG